MASAFPVGSTVRSVQTVTYALAGTTLTRSVNGGAAAVIASGVSGLTFTYLDGQNPPVVTGGNTLVVPVPTINPASFLAAAQATVPASQI